MLQLQEDLDDARESKGGTDAWSGQTRRKDKQARDSPDSTNIGIDPKSTHHQQGDHEFFTFPMHINSLNSFFAPNCRF